MKTLEARNQWRLMQVRATPELFATLIMQGNEFKVSEGIPEDVQIVGGGFDYPSRTYVIYIRHGSFDEVPVGCDIPVLKRIKIETKDGIVE